MSSGVVTVQSSGANTVQAMAANTTILVQSNATSGTGASVWNIVAYCAAASDITGSGLSVRQTSPTFITPALGAATATSIDFGGSTLNNYAENTTWTPVVTFATPGDVSVAYSLQVGYYSRVGNIVSAYFLLGFTPTYTTASGNFRITGLPFLINTHILAYGNCQFQAPAFPAGTTSMAVKGINNQTYMEIIASGSAVAAANFTTTHILTAVGTVIFGSLTYIV